MLDLSLGALQRLLTRLLYCLMLDPLMHGDPV